MLLKVHGVLFGAESTPFKRCKSSHLFSNSYTLNISGPTHSVYFQYSFHKLVIQLLPVLSPCDILTPWDVGGLGGEQVRGERTVKPYENKNEMSANWHVRINRKKM